MDYYELSKIGIQLERIADLMAADMKSRGLDAEVEAVNQKAKEVTDAALSFPKIGY